MIRGEDHWFEEFCDNKKRSKVVVGVSNPLSRGGGCDCYHYIMVTFDWK